MGLRKALRNPVTGMVSERWHVFELRIQPLNGAALVVLGGWGSDQLYAQGFAPSDTRVFELPRDVFLPLALAAPTGSTVYGSVARPVYEHIVTARRHVPVGSVRTNDVLTLPGGETVGVDQIDTDGPVPTIPSEFADAQMV